MTTAPKMTHPGRRSGLYIIGGRACSKNKADAGKAGIIRWRDQVPILSTWGRNRIAHIVRNQFPYIDATFRAKIGDGSAFLTWIGEHAPNAYIGTQIQNPGWEFTFIIVEEKNAALNFRLRWT